MSSVPTRVTSGRSSGGAARSRESGRSRTVTLPWSLPKRLRRRLRLRRLPLLCWLPDWLSQRPPCWLPFQSRRWPRSLLRLLVGGCGGRGRGVGAAGLVAGRWLVGSAGRGGPALRHVVRVVRAVSSGVGPRRRLRGGIRRGRLLGGPPRVIAVGPAVAFAALHRVRARARGLRPRPVRDGQLGHCHAGAACSAAGAALRAVAVRFGVAAGQRLLPGRLRGDGRCRRGASTATARSRRRNELDTLGLGDDRADQVGLAQTLVTLDTH